MAQVPDRVPAVIVRASKGEVIPAAGIEHLFKLTGAYTGVKFGLEELLVPPDTLGARRHIHWGHDKYFYVLDSELTVATDVGKRCSAPATWRCSVGAPCRVSATPVPPHRPGCCVCAPRPAMSGTSGTCLPLSPRAPS